MSQLEFEHIKVFNFSPWKAVDTTPDLWRPSWHLRNRRQRAATQAHLWAATRGSGLLSSYREISLASLLSQPSWQGNPMSFPCITKRFIVASESWWGRNCIPPLEEGLVRRIWCHLPWGQDGWIRWVAAGRDSQPDGTKPLLRKTGWWHHPPQAIVVTNVFPQVFHTSEPYMFMDVYV